MQPEGPQQPGGPSLPSRSNESQDPAAGGSAAHPRYKSEVFMPILQDPHSFEERQRTIWGDMHERMERRRKEWDDEVYSSLHSIDRV